MHRISPLALLASLSLILSLGAPALADNPPGWYSRQFSGAYEKHGRHSPKWDDSARTAVRYAQIVWSRPNAWLDDAEDQAYAAAAEARRKGCTDPLIDYIHMRFGFEIGLVATSAVQDRCNQIADEMEKAGYPGYDKAVASLYAAYATRLRDAGEEGLKKAQNDLERGEESVAEAFGDADIPQEQVTSLLADEDAAARRLKADWKPQFERACLALETNHPKSSLPLLAKGVFSTYYAWDGRGVNYSDKVTNEQWALFEERLKTAEETLEAAWKADSGNSEIAARMISVELGQGRGRDRMELWFKRAMEADPNNDFACCSKLTYLLPRWHGNDDEALAFAQECLEGDNWKARIPFILDDYYQYESSKDMAPREVPLYNQIGVWEQIQSLYDLYLKVCPLSNRDRSRYAYLACLSGHWSMAATQLQILGDHVWPSQFNGKFDEMRKKIPALPKSG